MKKQNFKVYDDKVQRVRKIIAEQENMNWLIGEEAIENATGYGDLKQFAEDVPMDYQVLNECCVTVRAWPKDMGRPISSSQLNWRNIVVYGSRRGSSGRHNLPAVYPFRYFVNSGGLISYGPDPRGRLRRSHPLGGETG
jgi:hypothetical protein